MCGIGANTLQNAPLGAFWSIRALAKTPRLEQKNAPLEQIWGFSALTLEQCSTCGSMSTTDLGRIQLVTTPLFLSVLIRGTTGTVPTLEKHGSSCLKLPSGKWQFG